MVSPVDQLSKAYQAYVERKCERYKQLHQACLNKCPQEEAAAGETRFTEKCVSSCKAYIRLVMYADSYIG